MTIREEEKNREEEAIKQAYELNNIQGYLSRVPVEWKISIFGTSLVAPLFALFFHIYCFPAIAALWLIVWSIIVACFSCDNPINIINRKRRYR